jgi:hypothetical protein
MPPFTPNLGKLISDARRMGPSSLSPFPTLHGPCTPPSPLHHVTSFLTFHAFSSPPKTLRVYCFLPHTSFLNPGYRLRIGHSREFSDLTTNTTNPQFLHQTLPDPGQPRTCIGNGHVTNHSYQLVHKKEGDLSQEGSNNSY